jgi:hypothetical protein
MQDQTDFFLEDISLQQHKHHLKTNDSATQTPLKN